MYDNEATMKWTHVVALGLSLCIGALTANYLGPRWGLEPQDALEAARRIRIHYEKRLHKLSEEKRGHFTLRLYRSSGDPRYLPPLKIYGRYLVAKYLKHIENLETPGYAASAGRDLLKPPRYPQAKHWNRAKTLGPWTEMIFAARLAFLMTQIRSLGFEKSIPLEFEKGRAYLSHLPWKAFILNAEVIRAYASRTSNMTYYLKDLGLLDLEALYNEKFREVFQSISQEPVDLSNHIYGMTHLMITDSGFYQRPVDGNRFAWILDGFTAKLPIIMDQTTPDVVAEVAVCFRLAGRHKDPVVLQIQGYLIQHFNPWANLIPSSSGKRKSLSDLEHRNILAYLALSDWRQLHRGPDLTK